MPAQGMILEAIPISMPAYSDTMPIIQGMMMAPLLAARAGHGSGIHAGHGKGKGEQQENGSGLGTGHHQAHVEDDAANAHFNHGGIAVFDRDYKCYEQAGNQRGSPHHGYGVGAERS